MGKASLYAPLKSLLAILFPPECLHCRGSHERLGVPLCESCVSYLEILPPPNKGNLLITFENIGPAQSLARQLKRESSSKTLSLLAAYMAIQYSQSTFPLPDVITAAPSSRFRTWQIGGDIAALLAKELGKLLERPFLPLLYRKRELIRQDLLSKEERLCLSSEDFQWKTTYPLRGKTILIIDDTITTGATLRCCAERLWEASPAQIIKMACLDQGYLQGSQPLDP